MDRLSGVFLISALIAIFFLLLPPAWADDCVQDRMTAPAPLEIFTQSNPLESTRENILAGRTLYRGGAKPFGCVHCHGLLGDGSGITGKTALIKPRDFTCREMMNNIPDGQLFWVIRHGSPGTDMVGYETLSDHQIWQIVAYIRQFSLPHPQRVNLNK